MTLRQKEPKYIVTGYEWLPGEDTFAYYKFLSNGNDSSGNGRNMTGTDITYSTLSNGNGVAYLNGSSSFFLGSYTDIGISTITMNIWIKKSRNSNGEYIFELRDTSPDTGIGIETKNTNTGNIGISYYLSSWQSSGGVDTGISNGTRMNVCFIITSSGSKLYVNGTQQTLSYDKGSASVGLNNAHTDSIVIGRHPSVSANHFQGYVSEGIIETKERTADEVSRYYDLTKGNYGYTQSELIIEKPGQLILF